ncbi:hypothetical protein TH63_04320 [Rufibacter radiotolerans]|uniref:Uncharacterized protein n=1 Tax=Rufibacter radiotolerans TaxID=1379910 RepID=A0A0H4VH70_9BACT|nr:hypothetical protein [Rufibacter radiotolerans]AKQ45030.1 hypothetical protein TH63_04320 [Rufibacter radiotolerans]
MLELDDIIELQTNSQTEKLSFATRYLVQINFTFDLKVRSGDFSGTSHFCVRRDEIESFCKNLLDLYSSLKGSARIEDNDSDGFVEFSIEPNGNLYVNGQVGGTYEEQCMKFKFKTDQTCIPRFVQDFNKLLLNKNGNY